MANLSDLHARYDGFVPRDEIERADGLDPALSEATGRVLFWRQRVRNAAQAWRSWLGRDAEIAAKRKRALDEAVAAYARALAHRRLVSHPATAAHARLLARIAPSS